MFQKIAVLVLCLTSMMAGAADLVKRTSSMLCHPPASPYYDRIQHYDGFPSLQACLDSGGALPKALRSRASPGRPSSSPSEYDRDAFGAGWADTDHDCQNTRAEVLIADSQREVQFAGPKRCRVVGGYWRSAYSGHAVQSASALDIDHIVPLAWAWSHGASAWSEHRRAQFANDAGNLVPVEASLNRSKGAQGPQTWLPPAHRCAYVRRFAGLVETYGLVMTLTEQNLLDERERSLCRESALSE